jgi:hypothetical protein
MTKMMAGGAMTAPAVDARRAGEPTMPEQTSDTTHSPEGKQARPASRMGNAFAIFVCALALGLLIWAKLHLVTGVPRTAIATPEQEKPAVASGEPNDRAGSTSR